MNLYSVDCDEHVGYKMVKTPMEKSHFRICAEMTWESRFVWESSNVLEIQVCVLEPTPGITQCKHNASLENWRARFTFVLACIVGACPPQELSLVFAPNLCKFH